MTLYYARGGSYPPTYDIDTNVTTVEGILSPPNGSLTVISAAWWVNPDFPALLHVVKSKLIDQYGNWGVVMKCDGDQSGFTEDVFHVWGFATSDVIVGDPVNYAADLAF